MPPIRLRSVLATFSRVATTILVGVAAVVYLNLQPGKMAGIAPLKFLTVPALKKHTASIIFVHGLGDTGAGWQSVAEMLNTEIPHAKWILPHSPTMSVTANSGMVMPSWFDIYSFGFDSKEDETGMLKTVHSLNQLITAEVDAGIPANRIVLGGFSQGAAMTLLTGLTGERRLAGIAVISGWLPLLEKFKSMVSDHAKSMPIFWGHGTSDPLVRHEIAVRSADFLRDTIGVPTAASGELKGLSFNSYQGVTHSMGNQELADMTSWLKKVLPPID